MSQPATPQFEIVSPGATEAEVAAVVTVLTGLAATRADLHSAPDRPRAGGWKSYYRLVRTPHAPGRDGWRSTVRF